MKFTSLFTLAALASTALAKDFTLYFSTNDAEYHGMFSSAIDTSSTKLNDAAGQPLAQVLGAFKFTSAPSETMIALSLDQSHVVWCTVKVNKELSVSSANLILSDGSAPGKVKSVLRKAVSSGKAGTLDASAVTLICGGEVSK